MLPVVASSAEVVLRLVPDSLREAALALGAPRWLVTLKVVLPAALGGLITGSLLAVARAAGETAPLLFTAAAVNGLSFDLNGRMNSLPVQIFSDVASPNDAIVQRAWGAALVLVAMVLVLTLIARFAARRSRAAMTLAVEDLRAFYGRRRGAARRLARLPAQPRDGADRARRAAGSRRCCAA